MNERQDATRNLMQRAHDTDPEQPEFDTAAGLADLYQRAARLETMPVAEYRPVTSALWDRNAVASSPGFGITLDTGASEPRVVVTGELDLLTSPQLQEALAGLIAEKRSRRVVADLTGVTFFDSSALNVVLHAQRQAGEQDVALEVVPSPAVSRMLELTRQSKNLEPVAHAGMSMTSPQHQGHTGAGRVATPSGWPARVAVVCTALDVEYAAVRRHLTEPLAEREVRGTLYEIGTFPGRPGLWTVVLVETGVGDTAAGIALERAISVFSPQVVLSVGVGGGRKDVALGDVVVADTIYEYDAGRDTAEGYLPRVRTHAASHRMVQRARAVARHGRWQRRIRQTTGLDREPAAIIRPLAAGGTVIADPRSPTAQFVHRHCSDAVAVEMEGHGFLRSAYFNDRIDALVVRGISDLLDKTESADKYWQPLASDHAAAFAFETLACHTPTPHT
ncbi:STAS domain-containing protein [Amycolatopsis sp. NPDC059021]|uniref:phosphorylase family protein n=1 Tax=Amycolatopsis sp. NPDC059021 TaxID=3346704 RepID=UPI003672E6A7